MIKIFRKIIKINDKDNFIITIEVRKLILVIIYFSTIFFNGGVYRSIDLIILNSYQDLIYLLFYLILPLVSAFVLYNYFKHDLFSFEIKRSSIFIAIIILLFIITQFLKNVNLYSDELYYTARCFNIINTILGNLQFDNSKMVLASITYGSILRTLLCIQWIFSILTLVYLFRIIDKKYGLALYLAIIFTMKLLLIYFRVKSGVHPPLNYLIPSLSIVLFGLNTITIKLSIIFVHLIFIVYIFNRLRLSILSSIFISLFIFSIPIIGYFTVYYEQAIYSFICFSVVLIETYLKKIKPQYVFLIISIFVLFRYTSISAYSLAIIYSCLFFYNENNKLNQIIKNVIKSCIPIILSIPILIFPLLTGTPTTGSLNTIVHNVSRLNIFTESLTANSFNVFELYLIIPISILIYLMATKSFKTITYIFTIYFSYHFLHQISDASVYDAKYYLEQFGFLIVFGLAILGEKLDKNTLLLFWQKIIIYVFLLFFLGAYSYIYQERKLINDNNQIHFFNVNRNFSPIKNFNNHYDYLFDYIKTKNIYDRVLVLGIDYGPIVLALHDASYIDYLNYHDNLMHYKDLKYQKNIKWFELDAGLINGIEAIDYVFITDYIYQMNKGNIDELVHRYNWNKFAYLPKTYNYSDIILFKRD